MSRVRGLHCRECGEIYPISPRHVCERCFGPLHVAYDYEGIARLTSRERIAAGPRTIWRYRDLLPIEGDRVVESYTGCTPLVRAENLGRRLGLRHLYLKNDAVNPSFSFKDRPVSVAASQAVHFGFDTLACASTGNLASSVACHAARAGLRAIVFVPADIESSKTVAASIYGPTVVAVEGTYDDVNRLCSEAVDQYGWAFVNINLRPFYAEGSKTLAFEVAEDLGWRAPDHVVVPVGSGALYTRIWQGFQELRQVGLLHEVRTRMHAAQAQGCAPIVAAHQAGTSDVVPVRPNTVARSLAIGSPADGYHTLQVLRECGGAAEAASDAEIVEGMELLARTEGIFGETAAGVTVAVLRKLVEQRKIDPDEVVVAYVTGNGLKTQEAVVPFIAQPVRIPPRLRALDEALARAPVPLVAVA